MKKQSVFLFTVSEASFPVCFKGSGERHDTKADMCGELPVHNKAAKTQLERQERTEFFTSSSKMDLH